MKMVTREHQAMLDVWQRHTHAEFLLKDPDMALATMAENPHVLCIPCGTGGVGRSAVREFYAEHFLLCIPPDFELDSLSQTFGQDRMVEEFLVRFTHTLKMDWMLPSVPATGKRVEVAFVGVIGFHAGKIASEHIYWDQATVLAQLGVLDYPAATAGINTAAQLRKLSVPGLDSRSASSAWRATAVLTGTGDRS